MGHRLIGGGACLFNVNLTMPLERLAALTPRPRVNLILYHGVLGARAACSLVLQHGTTDGTRPARAPPTPVADLFAAADPA